MAINDDVFNTSLVKSKLKNVKKVVSKVNVKVEKFKKLGTILDEEVVVIEQEVNKWRL